MRSGFCDTANPPESHARCHLNGCPCECHAMPEWEQKLLDESPITLVIEPGFYYDLDEETYHRDPNSLSHSGAKVLIKAPALFRYRQLHPVFKHTFEYGSAAHKSILGTGPDIRVIPDDVLASNGAVSTKEAKAFVEEARADGALPLKSSEAKQIDDMAHEITAHSFAMELLAEGRPEVSAYALDEPTGVMRRCRFDWLGATILSDYKTSTTSDPKAFGKHAVDFGYHQQAPWYLDVARDNGHPAEAFAFIVQMKEPPYLVTVIELKPSAVQRGRELNTRALQMYRDCLESDLWPGYVPDTDFAQVDIPAWAYNDNELEISR